MLSQEFIDRANNIFKEDPESVKRNVKSRDPFRKALATLVLEAVGEKVE